MDNLIDQTETSEIVTGKLQKKRSCCLSAKTFLQDFFMLLFTKRQLLYCLLSSPYIV